MTALVFTAAWQRCFEEFRVGLVCCATEVGVCSEWLFWSLILNVLIAETVLSRVVFKYAVLTGTLAMGYHGIVSLEIYGGFGDKERF